MRIIYLLAFLVTWACGAMAQPYPAKPVWLIVSYPAGGVSDYLARLVAEKLSARWNQPIMVEFKPGASGNIGASFVAKAAPDGYTLLIMPTDLAISPTLYRNLTYDALKDLAPISSLAYVSPLVAVHPSMGVSSLQELIAKAKAEPGAINFASCGIGTPQHLAGEMLKVKAEISMVHIPYKGCAPAQIDALSGQVPVIFSAVTNLQDLIASKKLLALAVTTSERDSVMPSVPTVAESGFPGFEVSNWFGLLAPAKTPPEVIAKINADLLSVFADADFKKRLHDRGLEPYPSTPEQFRTLIERDIEQFGSLIRRVGVQVD